MSLIHNAVIVSEFRLTAVCLSISDMGDVLQRTLHHPDDGDLLHLHRADLQRLFLQVSEYIRLSLERQGHVHKSAVDVS